MQLDRFTQKSREAIQASVSLAAQHKHAQVSPIHLLAALLRSDDALVRRILDRIGATVDAEVDAAIKALPTLATVAEPTTDPDVLAVLRAAEAQARDMQDEYVTTEHLLLALAGHDSRAGEILRSAREIGIHAVHVQTAATNLPALGLYQALGFQPIDQSTVYRLPANLLDRSREA